MPEAGHFEAFLSLIDRVSGPLRVIGEAFAGMGREAEHAGKQVKEAEHPHGFFSLAEHVRLVKGHFGELNANVGELGHSMTEFLPALGAIGAGASLAGLFELTEKVAESTSELMKMSKELGVSTVMLQQMDAVAKLTDISQETMDRGLAKLNVTMGEIVRGKNKDAAGLFHHLGISIKDAGGHIKTIEELLPDLANAFAKTADVGMRATMAQVLFGRSGKDLIPLLMEGKEGIAELMEEASKLVYTFNPEDKENVEAYHRSMVGLQLAVGGFTDEVGAKLAPVLRPVIDMAKEWVIANRHWIATEIAAKVKELVAWLSKIDWKGIAVSLTGWAHAAIDFGNAVGGLPVLIGAITLAMGTPFINAGLEMLTTLKEIARVALIEVPMAVYEMVAAMWAGEGAFAAIGVAFAANPLGVVIIGVTLLGTAAYELWQHWSGVKAHFEELFNWFSSQNGWVQALITITMPLVGLPLLIMDNWTPIKAFFERLWNDVAGFFQAAWDRIKPIVDDLQAAMKFMGGQSSGAQSVPPGVNPGIYTPPALPGPGGTSQYPLPPALRLPTIPARNPPRSIYDMGGASTGGFGGSASAVRGAQGSDGVIGHVEVGVKVSVTGGGSGTSVTAITSTSGNVRARTDTGQNHPTGDVFSGMEYALPF